MVERGPGVTARHAAVTTTRSAAERARELVLEFGWNTTSYQILNPGFEFWFSDQHAAVVGYVCAGGRRVVGGSPVCARDELTDVAREFERMAGEAGERVVYFGAEERLDGIYHGSRTHSSILLGAQPVWRPVDWAPIVDGRASLRAQLNRARNKGVSVELWTCERAEHNPSLQRCLREWLGTHGLPPLHFLVEAQTLGDLRDRRVFVAVRDDEPVGFLVASPIAARNGWLTEQFVRGNGAPNGTAELMIDAAVRWMAEEGAEYVTLGLAPLSKRGGEETEQSIWLRMAFRWVRAHGRRFYNFDGLDRFKNKFCPSRWEPVYAVANEPVFSIHSLYAIAAAFTEGHPIATVAHGLQDAVRQEVRWLKRHA